MSASSLSEQVFEFFLGSPPQHPHMTLKTPPQRHRLSHTMVGTVKVA